MVRYLGPPGSWPACRLSGSFGLWTVPGTSAGGACTGRGLLSTAPSMALPPKRSKPSRPEPPLGTQRSQTPASCGPGAKQDPGLKSWAPGMALVAVLGVDVWGRARHLQCRGRGTLALAQSRSGSGGFHDDLSLSTDAKETQRAESSLMAAWPCPPVLGTSRVTACGGLVGHVL